MELSWSHSSSVPDYSDDTFTSFSEEEETCREYDNDPFVSYSSEEDSKWPVGLDLSESTWQSLNQNDEAPTRIPEEEELGALQSFCAIKINRLSHPPSLAPLKRNKPSDQRHGRTSKKPLTWDLNRIVPEQLDSLTLIGEIHQTLPKLSEDPRNIWQELNTRALKAKCDAS
ncbi:hypothetical protein JD844_004276 [Phrynosoma platyrhinos]|uniref:Uncharacterized protein n=1 Tax=Phrynosoma platyrhinos TaxID=52577 RepID=A0ABQ7TMR1_PHRPL|nr:hypothetical protein JD844_004276 [Phrynosoma platyrhinos]